MNNTLIESMSKHFKKGSNGQPVCALTQFVYVTLVLLRLKSLFAQNWYLMKQIIRVDTCTGVSIFIIQAKLLFKLCNLQTSTESHCVYYYVTVGKADFKLVRM